MTRSQRIIVGGVAGATYWQPTCQYIKQKHIKYFICSGDSLFTVPSLNKKGRSKVVVCLSSCIDTQKYLDIFIFSDIYTNTMSDRLSFQPLSCEYISYTIVSSLSSTMWLRTLLSISLSLVVRTQGLFEKVWQSK